MFFSQTNVGNVSTAGLGLFGSTGPGAASNSLNLSASITQTGQSITPPAIPGNSLFQLSNSQSGISNSSNLFGTSNLNNSSIGILGSTGSNVSLFGASQTQNQPQTQINPQAQYLPLNPTIGQLTNYIQSWKAEFDEIENQLRGNDKHIEYLTNNKLIEITRLCSTYKKGVERRNEEIENIKSLQFRAQDSIESVISEITTVQQLSHDITHIYDRIKDIDQNNSSRQIQPLRFPLPIFEFFCENMAKKCKGIEEIIGNLDRAVSSLREELTNATAEDVLKYIAEIINNNYEAFYDLVTKCSQLHDKTESVVNISKLHDASRN
ncbi:hypothetical protein [Cryptosporidium parvum Iowa II]|uniref:Uncharacterized protein n=2 Tax=Cryptosporidium parvum TaxID=5807 RepID=Q5CRQ4_CRYPI|nr:hypothetical protein [Cryptosporidium parvum Iowa II]EAK88074.1 hypothetical protein cgd5_1890 [Cryptosporidium parvum Iowa II]QOY41622.1 Uncharacterized protein CPATCC_0023680 [Cryptosporidium parvum]WKS77843.1 hypothetical protein CPCDC_5g1890 [Cryptosporidium sp. 43IA8]WRK32334.1 Uncharacterized protein cpbgf_5001900 [Cryptosporidium parvum]|eukprot:QOY41622.1 hypothetical protein CPATCC_002194 [Cryptosporidium parvum]